MAVESKAAPRYAAAHALVPSNLAGSLRQPPTVYWINLDSSTQRREAMEARLKLLGLANERVSAIPKDASIINFYNKAHYSHLTTGELIPANTACGASHIKALRTFLKTNATEALIAEDDVLFRTDFLQLYDKARSNLPDDATLMSLGYMVTAWVDKERKSLYPFGGKNKSEGNLCHIYPANTWGAQLYWISQAYAIEVLERYDRPDYRPPWMCFNEMYIRFSNGYLAYPPLAIEYTDIDSDRKPDNLDQPYHARHFAAWGLQNYVKEN